MTETVVDSGTDAVLVDQHEGVCTLTLNRPDLRNALTEDVTGGLQRAFEDVRGSDLRCVVLTGAAEAFCAGGDVNTMLALQGGDLTLDDAVRHVVNDLGETIEAVHGCEVPTVAKVGGAAIGAGAALAIACDVQLLSDDATIGFGFRRVGLAVDSGTSYLLPRLVGDNVAHELVYTGERVDPERAASLGLVNHVYPADDFDDRVDDFVDRVASGPPVALRTSKRLLRADDGSLSSAIDREAGAQAAVLDSADHAEGVESFLERRDPEFSGR